MDEYIIEQLIQVTGLNNVMNYTIKNNDTRIALYLYYNYKKRIKGKKYHLISNLAMINIMTNKIIE